MLKLSTLILASGALAAFSTVRAQDTAAAAAPNDAQIVRIAVTADTVVIDASKIAAHKSDNKAVKELAETAVRDHTTLNAKAKVLVKKIGVTPEESDTSKSLKSDGDAEMTKLKTMNGAEFDKTYVDYEVSYHKSAIGMFNKTLIPDSKNAELKIFLESARSIFVSHLTHAKELQKSLSK